MDSAREEWNKFEQVDALLRSVNDYMAIYTKLQNSGELVVIGSSGIRNPKHDIPPQYDKESWENFDADQQYQEMMKMARNTLPKMRELGHQLKEKLGVDVKFTEGPLKGEERIKQKREEDYGGDIRRVIDVVRCSFVVVMEKMQEAANIVNHLRDGDFSDEWEIVRVKDGFEKPDNFLVGGYRDIKLNVKNRKFGHIIEMQLHLRAYYDLKQKGGHHHYQFARQQKVQGITEATQILNPRLLPEIYQTGMEHLERAEGASKKAQTCMRLGHLKMRQIELLSVDSDYREIITYATCAITHYDTALAYLDEDSSILYFEALMGLEDGIKKFESACKQLIFYDKTGTRPDLPELSRPEVIGMDVLGHVLKKAGVLLGPKHPFVLKAKSVKVDHSGTYEYGLEVIAELQSVLGNDHPLVAKTLAPILNQGRWKGGEKLYESFNMVVDVLEPNLKRLGAGHSIITTLIKRMNVALDMEKNKWILDVDDARTEKLKDILGNPEWNATACPFYLPLLRYRVEKEVSCVDSEKIVKGARVAVWFDQYQRYCSGKITEKKNKYVFFVTYDNQNSEWISTKRRRTMLLSHGSDKPSPFDFGNPTDVNVGSRLCVCYPDASGSYYTGRVGKKNGDNIKFDYDEKTTETFCLDESRPFFFSERTTPFYPVEEIKMGENLHIWSFNYNCYFLANAVEWVDHEDKSKNYLRVHYYSGDDETLDMNHYCRIYKEDDDN